MFEKFAEVPKSTWKKFPSNDIINVVKIIGETCMCTCLSETRWGVKLSKYIFRFTAQRYWIRIFLN